MLGNHLPIEIYNGVERYVLDFHQGSFRMANDDGYFYLKDNMRKTPTNQHIRNWFTLENLPPPDQCTYIQCDIKSLFFPAHSICLLVGFAEKYRKYFYPIQIDLPRMSCYLTGQPIYYNFNQSVTLDVLSEPPLLRIHSFSKTNDDLAIYQPRSKRNLDLFWEPPINLIRVFMINPNPDLYKLI